MEYAEPNVSWISIPHLTCVIYIMTVNKIKTSQIAKGFKSQVQKVTEIKAEPKIGRM